MYWNNFFVEIQTIVIFIANVKRIAKGSAILSKFLLLLKFVKGITNLLLQQVLANLKIKQ